MKRVSQKVISTQSNTAFNSRPMSPSKKFRSEISQLWTEAGADKIFHAQEDFVKWLNAPNPGLEGFEPIHFIKSDNQKIADLLGRILHGVLA